MEYETSHEKINQSINGVYKMSELIEVRMNGKVLTNSKVIGYMEDLTKGCHLESFYKASSELQPLLENAKADTTFEVELPFGIYHATVESIAEVVNEVINTRTDNQKHYDAIEKANTILSTLSCFELNGQKPESKRGKPKSELKFE